MLWERGETIIIVLANKINQNLISTNPFSRYSLSRDRILRILKASKLFIFLLIFTLFIDYLEAQVK